MVLENAGEFAVRPPPAGARCVWGHVHQEHDCATACGWATPSTCFQFKPRSVDFALMRPRPVIVVDLHPDGRIDSGVCRLARVSTNLDMQSSGYK